MARVAVVTGGSAGIGLATAEHLARAGWAVAILARDPARLAEAAELVRGSRNAAVLAIPADVSDSEAVFAAAEQAERELGPIAAWVNNAMSTVVAPADAITPAEYARVTATTYLSQVHGTLAALRFMKPRDRGAIVQVSSGLAIRPAPLQAAYCGAKAAVTGFTDALRAELIADESAVTLTVVYLPAVNTPQFGWSRLRVGHEQVAPDPVFDPRLCARAIAGAIERPSREVWVGRSTMQMAVGQAVVPGIADREAAKMRDAQLGASRPDRPGNLDAPVPGPAVIDGSFGDRVLPSREEYVTSRPYDRLTDTLARGIETLSARLGGRR